MMQMLMHEDFVAKLRAAKTPQEFLDLIDAQEQQQFGSESFTQEKIGPQGYRILAVTACPTGIAHTYMAAEALVKAGDKLGLPCKVETNGSGGAKNILTAEEIAACDGIIVAADKNVETARFDGKPVLFTRVDDGIHKPEELIQRIESGEIPVFHAKGGKPAAEATGNDTLGHTVYKHLMNGVSHMLPFVVGGGILIALAFLFDDFSIDPSNFGMNTPLAAFFKTVGNAAFSYMLPILSARGPAGSGRRFCGRRPGHERYQLLRPAGRQHHRHIGRLPGRSAGWLCGWLPGQVPGKYHRKAPQQRGRHPAHADLSPGRYAGDGHRDVCHQPHYGPHQ